MKSSTFGDCLNDAREAEEWTVSGRLFQTEVTVVPISLS